MPSALVPYAVLGMGCPSNKVQFKQLGPMFFAAQNGALKGFIAVVLVCSGSKPDHSRHVETSETLLLIPARDTENEAPPVVTNLLFQSLSGLHALYHDGHLIHDQPHAVSPLIVADLLEQMQHRIGPDPEAALLIVLLDRKWH